MYSTITRRYTFSAAHRLEGHPQCGRPHGHNYVLEVSVQGPLGEAAPKGKRGMLIDFKDLDVAVNDLLGSLDHMWLYSEDNVENSCPYTKLALDRGEAAYVGLYSTCEYMSNFLYSEINGRLLQSGKLISVKEVRLWETERGSAIYP